jgi:two-component system sensor histidine kinase/response regulator
MIMISSAARAGDLEHCRQLDISRYLMKPIIQSELLNALLDAVGAAAPSKSRENATAGPKKLRVLLAEDAVINQRVAVGFLEQFGHDVVVANDGSAAVKLFKSGDFDVVLMDIQMPEMDGYDATAAIRKLESGSTRRTAVIAMTAAAMKGDRERCLEVGMDGYIAKPINPDQLFETLDLIARTTTGHQPTPAQPTLEVGFDRPNSAEVSAFGFEGDGDIVDLGEAGQRIPGGIEAVRELAQTLLEECPRLVEEIRQGLATQDAALVERGAHTLKGSADIFAAKRVVAGALRIETMGREGELGEAQVALADLEIETNRLCQAIKSAFPHRRSNENSAKS